MGVSPLADSPGSFLRYKINKGSHDMMFQGIQVPEAPGRRDEQAAPPPSDDNRGPVDEIDFFAGKGRSAGHDQDHDDNNIHGSKTIRFSVEKDNSHGEEAPRPGLNVDSALHLFTANTGSDQSTVDDGISSDANDKLADPKVKLADAENKLAKSESLRATLQMELRGMNSENRRLDSENRQLKDRLAQVTNNDSVLPMNPVASMQQQQNQGATYTTQDHEVVESKSEERKHEINVNGGAGSPADQTDEVSHASSEDRTISGSPRNASKSEVVREGKRVRLEESPESESQGWNPNKIPKLNPSKPAAIDQSAEATMMKPRVSDRARSEAPMVSQDMGPSQLAHHAPQSPQQPPHQPQQPQLSLDDLVSAVKAAISIDPNFTASLAANISSIISRAHPNNNNNIDNNNNKINDNNNDNNNNKINNSNSNNTTTNINFSSHPSSKELIQRIETTETTKKVTTTIYPFLRDKFIGL